MRQVGWMFNAAIVLLGLGMVVSSVEGGGGNLDSGKVIYEKHCLACHGTQGKGDTPIGKVLHPQPLDFASVVVKTKTDADLLTIIQNGVKGTAMTGWKSTLSEQEMLDVLAYIRAFTK